MARTETLHGKGEARIMARYVTMEEQVDFDFTRARRKAFFRRIHARFFGDPASTRMRPFEDISNEFRALNRVRLGKRAVAVEKIVGSVGRSGDFDRSFLPARMSLEERWKRVDRAYHMGQDLPPVSLFKLGDSYFVEDGNHRVSVARYQGIEWIDAEVTVLHGGVSAAPVRGTGKEPMEKERAVAPQPLAA
jgi:hypothetical protein